METVNVTLEPRTVTGKAVKHLRKDGIVPAVIHDHGKESIIVQAEYQTLYKAYQDAGRHAPVYLTANGHKYTALIKSVTFDPIYSSMTHIVFNAVKANEKVETSIPIHPRFDEGNEATPAERAGFIVLANLDAVEVKALAKNLPDAIEYDGEKLVNVGDHATVADLIVPEGVEIETPADKAVATVYEPSALQAANEDAGGDTEGEAASEQEGTADEGTKEEKDDTAQDQKSEK